MKELKGLPITIDEQAYDFDLLSEAAKAQLANVQAFDQGMAYIQQKLAIFKTVRNSYAKALNEAIAEKRGSIFVLIYTNILIFYMIHI